MRVLFVDIETAPSLAYCYGRYNVNISPDQVASQGFILCFQYAWNDGPVKIRSLKNAGKLTPKSDKELVQELAELVTEADIVVAHNGVRFDLAILAARLAAHKLKPFAPPAVVDTLKECRKHFKFAANSLDAVCQELGLGRKGHSGGYETAIACVLGDKRAWTKLLRYGKQDVVLLRELYYRIRPFMKNHPNLNVIDDTIGRCRGCGSGHLTRQGTRVIRLRRVPRFQCQTCGAWQS